MEKMGRHIRRGAVFSRRQWKSALARIGEREPCWDGSGGERRGVVCRVPGYRCGDTAVESHLFFLQGRSAPFLAPSSLPSPSPSFSAPHKPRRRLPTRNDLGDRQHNLTGHSSGTIRTKGARKVPQPDRIQRLLNQPGQSWCRNR